MNSLPSAFLLCVGVSLLIGACSATAAAPTATPSYAPTAPATIPTKDFAGTVGFAASRTPPGPGPTAAPSVATSRGSNLVASDPELVRLDSGNLQLVEFFRFT